MLDAAELGCDDDCFCVFRFLDDVTPASFKSLSGPFEGFFVVVVGRVVGASVVVGESVVKTISSSSTSLTGETVVVVVVFFPDRDRVRDKTVLFLGALAHGTLAG